MKKVFIAAIVILLTIQIHAQNRLPGPVKVLKDGKYILLDVTDSTMIDFNGHVKLYQTGDTLLILSNTGQVIAKFAPDKVRFPNNDTITLPGTKSIKLYQDASGNFVININGHLIYYSVDSNLFSSLEADYILLDSLRVDGQWFSKADLASGGSGTISGSIASTQVPYGTAANTIGGNTYLTYNAVDHLLYSSGGFHTTGKFFDNGEHFSANAGVSNGSSSIAYKLSTINDLTGNAEILEVSNITDKKFYVKDDTTVVKNILAVEDSVDLRGYTYVAGQLFTMSSTGRLKPITPTQSVQILVPDTLAGTTITTGYGTISVGDALAGKNLVKVQCLVGVSQGTSVPTVTVWRNRSGTEVNMTSTGANFTTAATINTANDDLVTGDRIEVRMALGAGTPPEGVKVELKFQ